MEQTRTQFQQLKQSYLSSSSFCSLSFSSLSFCSRISLRFSARILAASAAELVPVVVFESDRWKRQMRRLRTFCQLLCRCLIYLNFNLSSQIKLWQHIIPTITDLHQHMVKSHPPHQVYLCPQVSDHVHYHTPDSYWMPFEGWTTLLNTLPARIRTAASIVTSRQS